MSNNLDVTDYLGYRYIMSTDQPKKHCNTRHFFTGNTYFSER